MAPTETKSPIHETNVGAAKKKGRPKGTARENAETRPPVADLAPTRCPRCGSTETAAGPTRPRTQRYSPALMHEGVLFNLVVYRRVRCAACGLFRTDREWRFEPEETPPEPSAEPAAVEAAAG
jgi:hypothetical protein